MNIPDEMPVRPCQRFDPVRVYNPDRVKVF